jgi:sigma-B regulation protein RsbU (phosphoserine phosphatase)
MEQQQAAEAAAGASPATVEEVARVLALHPTFGQFDPASLAAVAAHCGFTAFAAGETIMTQGERGTLAYMILDGEADVFVELPAGPIHMATLGRHRMVGELGAFAGTPRTATIVARTALAALRIERDSLMSLVAEYPAIAASIITELGRRLHRMNRSLALLSYAATALGRDEYDDRMLAELTSQPGELANFARVFANMAAEIRQKRERREEMRAAAAIQKSILPAPLPRAGLAHAVDLYAEMRPAREIGGDFYDHFMIGERWLALTVADVSGKGIPAALFMAVSRTILRGIAGADAMARRMTEANRLLAAENTASMFVTIFHAVLDLTSGVLRYCNAGHNPPYLLRAAGGCERLQPTGIPFGIDAEMPYRIDEAVLGAGDSLFLFSDGITEAFNPAGEEFGDARLAAALAAARGGDAARLVAGVLAATADFAAGAEQSDDITCLALVFRP